MKLRIKDIENGYIVQLSEKDKGCYYPSFQYVISALCGLFDDTGQEETIKVSHDKNGRK